MTRTSAKLDEARFFLRHIDQSKTRYPEFDYYLNAFLGSARSVLWVMRAEYQDVPGWKTWYDSKQLTTEDKTLFDALRDVRNRSVKRGTVETEISAIVDIPKARNDPNVNAAFFATDTPGKVEFVPLDGSEATAQILRENRPIAYGVLKTVYRRVDEFPEEDVVSVCKKYLERLESLVNECGDKFAI